MKFQWCEPSEHAHFPLGMDLIRDESETSLSMYLAQTGAILNKKIPTNNKVLYVSVF